MYPLRSHPVARGTNAEFELPAPLKVTKSDHKRTDTDPSNVSAHKRRPSPDQINDYVPLAPPPTRKPEAPSIENEQSHQKPPPGPWSANTRPLSDIRELTEPSLVEDTTRKNGLESGLARSASISRKNSLSRKLSKGHSEKHEEVRGRKTPARSPDECLDRTSIYSIPPGSVPPRSSSHNRRDKDVPQAKGEQPGILAPAPRGVGLTVPNRGRSKSPIKDIIARYEPISSDTARRVPSRTFYRTSQLPEIADSPVHRHPRINVEIHLGASLFVGGGSIEGTARISIDDAERIRHKRALALGQISVDLVGIEEITGAKRSIFLNLATELVDAENPPPHGMVESLKQISAIDPFWHLAPSISVLPFTISLPLDVGPPPFNSKHARIRYLLSVTLLVRDQGKQYLVRQSQDITVIPVYDPEKALMSLPSPLTASDEHLRVREATVEIIRVTAGLHRQVWVSGTNIFVDVHVANNSRKAVRRMELQLERDILCYKHAAASTLEKSASQARIFDSNERTILTRNVIKAGHGAWSGIAAHTTEIRTCDLPIPRGHATVKCGKFFEVRYFLNIAIGTGHSKLVTIQLPIVLIHMNSLDVVPNSVAQVAAAIEEKRAQIPTSTNTTSSTEPDSPTRPPRATQAHLTRKPSLSVQGRAFAAPRMQSLDRMRADAQDLAHLAEALEASPRKQQHSIRRVRSDYEYATPKRDRSGKGKGVLEQVDEGVRRGLRRMRSTDSRRSVLGAIKVSAPTPINTTNASANAGSRASLKPNTTSAHTKTASTETVKRWPSKRSHENINNIPVPPPAAAQKPQLGLQREPGRFDPVIAHNIPSALGFANSIKGSQAQARGHSAHNSRQDSHTTNPHARPQSHHRHPHRFNTSANLPLPTQLIIDSEKEVVDGFRARLEEAKQQRQFAFQERFKKKRSGEKKDWKEKGKSVGLSGMSSGSSGWLGSLAREKERDGRWDTREGGWI